MLLVASRQPLSQTSVRVPASQCGDFQTWVALLRIRDG